MFNPNSFSAPELAQYKNTPALPPPTGVTPNLAAHNDKADVYIVLCSILLAIVYLFVSLRMYSKVWINRAQGVDDLAAILATIGSTALFAMCVLSFSHGVGKHQWDESLDQIQPILRWGRYLGIILPPTVLLIKLSLLLLYLRIFGPDKVTRYLIYFGITFCSVAYTIVMFLSIFASVQGAINGSKTVGAINLSSDIYILCVPIMAASKLQMSRKRRIGLFLVFFTGILACIMSVISLVFRLGVQQDSVDATFLISKTFLVTTIENNVGLMCACMPFFPTLIKESSLLQKCFHSIQMLGSGCTKSLGTNTSKNANTSYERHSGRRFTITEDSFQLPDNQSSGDVTLNSPKKSPRMEFEPFAGDDRPKIEWSEV